MFVQKVGKWMHRKGLLMRWALVEPTYVPKLAIRFTLGDVVRKLRDEKAWSIRDAAKAAGVAVGAWGLLENDSDKSEMRTISRAAKALGTDVPTLMSHADPVFVSAEQRELLTVFSELAPARQQFVLTAARREHEAQTHGESARDAAVSRDQETKAAG